MKINTTEEWKRKFKDNQERLKKEISRIESLNLTSKGSQRYLRDLNEYLKQSFESWKEQEESKDNITGVGLE